MRRKKTTEQFITDARKVHGDKYDYSLVEYESCQTKIIIICPDHGEFKQIPNDHLSNHGCEKCGTDSASIKCALSTEEFIEKAWRVHGYKYDYSNVEYLNNHTKVNIMCINHGDFEQSPNSHLMGVGCPECGKIKKVESRIKNRISKKFEGLVQPEDHKLIPLTKGKFAVVDNEDFDRLKCINWQTLNQGYAYNNKFGLMHRYIMNAPDDMLVDHKEHDTLDNRKSNLRLATVPQNGANQRPQKGGSSKYKGVSWVRHISKWTAQVAHKGVRYRLGVFDSEIECAKAYDRKSLEVFGEFAYLNFPELKEQYLKEIDLNIIEQ